MPETVTKRPDVFAHKYLQLSGKLIECPCIGYPTAGRFDGLVVECLDAAGNILRGVQDGIVNRDRVRIACLIVWAVDKLGKGFPVALVGIRHLDEVRSRQLIPVVLDGGVNAAQHTNQSDNVWRDRFDDL